MAEDKKRRKDIPVNTYVIEPFDIGMFATEAGLSALHQNFTGWLSGLTQPARFVCWQLPVSLNAKINEVSTAARIAVESDEQERALLCQQYRRHYEELQDKAKYQRSICGMALWSEENPIALAAGMRGAFDTPVTASEWPPLFHGDYMAKESPTWHLTPVGRPQNRPYWAILVSYDFMPSTWNFFKPLASFLQKEFPMALAIDISQSFDRNEGINQVESIMAAYSAHLATVRGEDSRSVQRMKDCRLTLNQINDGDTLHRVQIAVAVSANNLKVLRDRVATIINEVKPWFSLRQEVGELLMRSVGFFAPVSTKDINVPNTSHPVTSRELALFLAPLGYPKLTHTNGILRGDSATGNYPLFYDSWRDKSGRDEKRCVHEVWVGVSGFGKTFYCNCYLSREYAEGGVPFDLLEPMGHGKLVADAFGLDWYVIGSRTKINPQDVVMPTSLSDQVSHVIRLYETMLSRMLTGDRESNIERGLLGEALSQIYNQYGDFRKIKPEDAPTCDDVVNTLQGLGGGGRGLERLARNLADEIASVACGHGPFADFVNGRTNIDLSFEGKKVRKPRVFSFHEMGSDPIMLGLAYTQVLSAIRRDSLADQIPRIIAVDEVYRLMRHPALLDFLVEAAKTFRTQRKKLICIDQNMSVFLEGKARLIFENSPIRVIFNQRQGLNVFKEDAAFQHLNKQHLDIISRLPRFKFVLDVQDEGLWYLSNAPSHGERARFNKS